MPELANMDSSENKTFAPSVQSAFKATGATTAPKNLQKTVDDLKQTISKLKAELEAEKAHSRQLHRDKVMETKQLREAFKVEKDDAVKTVLLKAEHERQAELSKLKETLRKEKDAGIRDLLREHEEHVKQLQHRWTAEKEESIAAALELQKRTLSSDNSASRTSYNNAGLVSASNSALVVKLQREIKALKDEKLTLEQKVANQSSNFKGSMLTNVATESTFVQYSPTDFADDAFNIYITEQFDQVILLNSENSKH